MTTGNDGFRPVADVHCHLQEPFNKLLVFTDDVSKIGQLMEYASGQTMRVGDEVIAQGMTGVIVCDFDNREFAIGYSDWDAPEIEMLGGGTLSKGVMIETAEAGLVYYEDASWPIDFVRAKQA